MGPATLVLGDEAQKNGLAVSLLERLLGLYDKLGEAARNHCVTLVTNYRCHRGILELAEKLFYNKALNCNVPNSLAYPAAPYPLLFFCSSIDDTVQAINSTINKQEADITLTLVEEFAKKWPTENWGPLDLSQVCFMNSTRNQVCELVFSSHSLFEVLHLLFTAHSGQPANKSIEVAPVTENA